MQWVVATVAEEATWAAHVAAAAESSGKGLLELANPGDSLLECDA